MLKSGPLMMDPRWKSNIELAPNCPRCASTNTKFCYYNNYSLSQPRYFCKSCKRYWTKGGSLRNVPFGGGCRKTRRGKSNRFPTPGRISTTTGRSVSQPNSDFQEDDTLGNLDPTIKSTRTHGSDIDLAAVFSKFLNQDSSSDPGSEFPNEIDGSLDLLNSSNQDYAMEEQNVIECQGVLNPTQDAELIGRLPEVLFQPEFDPQFVGPDTNNYGLDEGFLSDGVGQDGLWSSDDFSWQASQLQGFEQDPNDHLTSYPDLLRSNWSSLNIPSYST